MTLDDLHQLEREFISSISDAPVMSGRGIVTSIYDAEFASGWVLLNELKRLDVNLPVEVWYRDGELSERQITALADLDPRFSIKRLQTESRGWAIKPASIMESEFEEVLWIDSDNVPVRDPSFLFRDAEYTEKGSLFWRDVSGADRANRWHIGSPVWQVFDVPYNDAEEFDSGQLLVNKTKCWKEMLLTRYYNDMRDVYWQFVHGDKDTFRLAWQRVGRDRGLMGRHVNYLEDMAAVPYGFMPYGPFHVGAPNPWGKWGGGSVMVQRDREGQPLFNHRTIFKFKYGDNVFNADVVNESHYHRHLESIPR